MAFTGTVRPRERRRSPRRRRVVIGLAVAVTVALIACVAVAVVAFGGTSASARASSSAPGGDLEALVSGRTGEVRWTSVGETTGAWVEARWPEPRVIGHVRIAGPAEQTFASARLTFSDGSALLVTPDDRGEVDVSFASRTTAWVRLTVTAGTGERDSVALASFVASGGGAAEAETPALRAEASSTADGTTADALVDGDPKQGDVGEEWLAAPDATEAAATVEWDGAREIAAVRIWGPTAEAFDPAYSAAAALNGRLRFSDGSTVRISGIAGGAGAPTTIAFTPRVASSVTVDLEKTIEQAIVGLRAVAVYTDGESPAVVAGEGAAATSTDPASCDATTPAIGTAAPGVISLICPASSASFDGETLVRVAAPAGTALTASTQSVTDPAQLTALATATAGEDGSAHFTIGGTDLPHGPLTVLVAAADAALRPLHVQLFNAGGTVLEATGARSGGALVWNEDFERPLSLSGTGSGTTYAAAKPEYWGTSQFGDAVFSDPVDGSDTFSVIDGALRIRVQPLDDREDTAGFGRQHLGGLLSSHRVGASGFSAQYGYYEARMLAPGGNGTWPAFWMMNADSATVVSEQRTEVDAVELYGNDLQQTCHAIHNYTGSVDDSDVQCIDTAIATDWAAGWHTYGVQIEPGRAVFFVDGTRVRTLTGLTNSDQPFFFMANLALGGGWPVELTPSGDRVDLWIDYIRVSV